MVWYSLIWNCIVIYESEPAQEAPMAPHQGWLALAAAALPCTALLLLLAAVPTLAGVLVASSLLTSLVWWAR